MGNVVLLVGGDLVPVLELPSAAVLDDEDRETPSPAPPLSVDMDVRAELVPAPRVPGLVPDAGVAVAS